MAEDTKGFTPAAGSMKANQMMVMGRIDHVSKFDGNTLHIVITPAVDAYSKPSVLRVSSLSRLGEVGEDVRALCTFEGWPNNYALQSGEKVRDVKGFFKAVE